MIVQSKEMLTAIAQHKERRRREQQKTSVAVPVSRCSGWESGEHPQESEMAPALHDDSADDDCDPPEDYREYVDWRQDYANSVGMPLYEKIR